MLSFYTQDIDTVLRLFIALASCDLQELGYDTSIKRVSRVGKAKHPAYEIEVGNKTYTTRNVIADFGADAMCGRGTRVWKVCDESGKEYALKDCYIDSDREREGYILEGLYHKLPHPDMAQVRRDARKHFLTVSNHGDVMLPAPGQHGDAGTVAGEEEPRPVQDQTLTVMRRNRELMYHKVFKITTRDLTRNPPNTKTSAQDGSGKLVPPRDSSLGGVPHKHQFDPVDINSRTAIKRNLQHYRIVFEEVAESLYAQTTLQKVFTAIHGALKGA